MPPGTRFSLTEAARRPAAQYSGDMRRRLDLAASMIGRPTVLCLDEPTTGLDPRTRNEVWEEVRRMAGDGATVLLTTQYREEAEQLADELTVFDRGRVIASGRVEELKAKIGGRTLRIRPADRGLLAAMARALPATTADLEAGLLNAPILSDAQLTSVITRLGVEGFDIADISTRLPSLDEVFLAGTGHRSSLAWQTTRPAEVAA